MPGRPSSRFSRARDQPSSPPQAQPPSNSRRTRSASTELGGDGAESDGDIRKKRGRRQASVESVDSNTSADLHKGPRTRKGGRTAVNPDLSMVTEEESAPQLEKGHAAQTPHRRRHAANALPSQSPGALSQMSGTTAMTSFTSMTTHSMTVLAELDPILVECLPDLWSNSCKILDLLAPPGATLDVVESTVKELKILGSMRARRLRYSEDLFKPTRDRFGGDDYIKIALILRKLFGDQEPGMGDFRPDGIVYAANLATLTRDFLVTEKESQSMQSLLAVLDTFFPEVFVTNFDASVVSYGNSRLLDETFSVGLDIRTYYAIYALESMREQENWDPEEVLVGIFYEPLLGHGSSLSNYQHALSDGNLKDIMRQGPSNSKSQVQEIQKRMDKVHSTFRRNDEELEEGDLVDFERLEELFPWPAFLTSLVFWCRSRLNEISKAIENQGGVESIAEHLAQAMEANDTQVQVDRELAPPVTDPRPVSTPSDITRGVGGKSFYTTNNARRLFQMRRQQSSYTNPPPDQEPTAEPSSRPSDPPQAESSTGRELKSSTAPNDQPNDSSTVLDEEYEESIPSTAKTSLAVWNAHADEKNKENRPIPSSKSSKKPSFLDRQPGAHKVYWDDYSQEIAANKKRAHPSRDEAAESDQSQDEGFQNDERALDPSRREVAPPARRRTTTKNKEPPTKRMRVSDQNLGRAVHKNRDLLDEQLQASASGRTEENEDSEGNEEEEDPPRPTFAEVQSVARSTPRGLVRENIIGRAAPNSQQPQRRTRWSEADTESFVSLIEQYGTSWSYIQSKANFEVERDQVALKDKARNLKVVYLKAGTPLPYNFDKIPLSQKEINIVRTVIPGYDPYAYGNT